MITAFNKYQGTGNDFIIIDNRNSSFNPSDAKLVSKLCSRKFGIGADGLILINNVSGFDFEMVYFNADGFESTMCGNGGRCAADFAIRTGIADKKMIFKAFDGPHEAISENGIISLKMNNVGEVKFINGNFFINTGSPHYILFTKNLKDKDIYDEGKRIRFSKDFPEGGTNVNFVEIEEYGIYVRTYERGVENETLSCGTGVTASAIASVLSGHFVSSPVNVRTEGGDLRVEFDNYGNRISNIWLSGPATFVFEGKIEI